MALNTTHPLYDAMSEDWAVMCDCYAGERTIKEKGIKYLMPTQSMILDGYGKIQTDNVGNVAYDRYRMRAVFHDYVSDAVEALVGMLHQKQATIKLPAAMEPLRNRASREGETLQQLLRRINEQQLVCGRLGLLADLPEKATLDPKTIPYLALYNAQSVVNWDTSHDDIGLDVTKLVVLNETAFERTADFTWREMQKYRVLMLAPEAPAPAEGEAATGEAPSVAPGTYITGVFRYKTDDGFNVEAMAAPTFRGRPMMSIPFEFVNSKDVIATPDNPPLMGLARLCLAIYRGEADYRQNLFMQGQDTLVIVGGTVTPDNAAEGDSVSRRVGAGAVIDVNLGGDAKYVGVSGEGLAEQRVCLENDKLVASTKAGQLVSPQAGKQESGDALTTRISAQTASLMQIAITGAAGLERSLRNIARWMGLNEEEVSVEANTEFLDHLMTFKDLSDAMDARMKGAPTSLKTIHDNMVARGMTELSFEEEIAQIVKEKSMAGAQPVEPPSVTLAATPTPSAPAPKK